MVVLTIWFGTNYKFSVIPSKKFHLHQRFLTYFLLQSLGVCVVRILLYNVEMVRLLTKLPQNV